METSPSLESLLSALKPWLEARSGALDLDLRLTAPPLAVHLPAAAAPALRAGLDAALAALPRRAAHRDGSGQLALSLVLVTQGAPRVFLRVLLEDDRPGLPRRHQAACFAGLDAKTPALPDEDLLGLGSLAEVLVPLGRRPDFISGPLGSLLWWDLPVESAAVEGTPSPPAAVPGWSRRPRLDRADLLRRLGGNATIAEHVIAVFRDDAPRQLAALRESRELAVLQRLCHGLKGAAQNVGGLMLAEVARAGEWEAGHGRIDRVAAILPRLEWELSQLEAAWED